MEFTDALFSFSTKLVFNTQGLPNELKVYWSKLLSFFYADKYTNQVIRQKVIQSAILVFNTDNDLAKEFESLDRNERILTIVLIKLLLKKSEAIEQPVASDSLISKIKDLTILIGQEDANLVETFYNECWNDFTRHENRQKIVVPASILPLALDYSVKWMLLIYARLNSLPADEIIGYAFFESFIFIGAFALISYFDRRHNQRLFEKHRAVEDYKIDFQFSAQKYTWLAFFFISSLVIGNFIDVKDEGGTVSDYFSNGIFFVVYYFIALRLFPSGRASESSLLRQLRTTKIFTETLDSDKNDEAIVNIETEINSRTGRLDAYVLESALFGALAFSGFLQIIATDYVSFKELNLFSKLAFGAVQNLVSMDWQAFHKVNDQLYTKNNLFCLAAIQTLLCSGFFIAVIASRLRFSNVADQVKKALEVAKAYNLKEELLTEKKHANYQERLAYVNSKVNEQILISQKALEEISPISGYMEYFRNAGLLMFLLVLISCGLFVTSFLGWLFVGIGAATWIYFNGEYLTLKAKEFSLSTQVGFSKKSYVLLIASILLLILGFVFRIFWKIDNTNLFITIGFGGIGLYLFFKFIMAPEYDEYFGFIQKSNDTVSASRFNAVKLFYGALIFLSIYMLGQFAYNHYDRAVGYFVMPTILMFLLNFFIGFYYSKKKWIGMLIAASLLLVGLVFCFGLDPTQFGRKPLPLIVAFGIAFVAYLIMRLWRKNFHRLFRSIVAIYSSILFLFALPLIYGSLNDTVTFSIPVTLTSLYQHKVYKFDSLSYWLNFRIPKGLAKEEKLNFYKTRLSSYLKHFGAINGYTFVYEEYLKEVGRDADSLFQSGKTNKDSVTLKKALEFEREKTNVHRLFKYKNIMKGGNTEAEILMALNKKAEAENSLMEIIKSEADEEVIKEAKKRLAEIKGNKPK